MRMTMGSVMMDREKRRSGLGRLALGLTGVGWLSSGISEWVGGDDDAGVLTDVLIF